MSKSSPPSPDYVGAAQAQGQASQALAEQQTVANRPNVTTPQGTQSWQMTPTWDPVSNSMVSQWTLNQGLTPALQAATTGQQSVQAGEAGSAAGLLPSMKSQESEAFNPFSVNQVRTAPGPTTTGATMPSATGFDQQASDAAFNQFESYNQPLFSQANSQLDTQLRNQGLVPGDAAYDTAMSNLKNTQGLQTTQAQDEAILSGAQIGSQQFQNTLAGQQQEFGQGLTGAEYNNQVGGMQLAQALQERGFSLDQIQAIIGGGAGTYSPNIPGFATAGAGTAPNLLGAAEAQGTMAGDIYSANQAQQAGTEEGVGSLALAAAMIF